MLKSLGGGSGGGGGGGGGLFSVATSIAANSGGITLPSGYGTILITGTSGGSPAVTCPCTMPATPVDQQVLIVMFAAQQTPSFTANAGQSFPDGAPNSQACNTGSWYQFFYDGSNKLGGGTASWYVMEYLGADGLPFSQSQSATTGSIVAAIQSLNNDVATIAGTANQIAVATTVGPPNTFTLSLPADTNFPARSDGSLPSSSNTVGYEIDTGNIPTTGTTLTSNTAAAVVLTSGTTGTSLQLTAGNWLVFGNVLFSGTATTIGFLLAGLNTSTSTLPTLQYYSNFMPSRSSAIAAMGDGGALVPRYFGGNASAFSVSIVCEANFSAGTMTGAGSITAIRMP
jgi:hypothetical protein